MVAFDVRGHGTNNSVFVGDIRDDLIAVLDTVDDGGDFDENRIALVGHSMGAFLVSDHASRDERIRATVVLAGGRADGPMRPKNILFLVSSGTDEDHSEGRETAADIAGREVSDGEVVGDFAAGTAVGVDTVDTSVAMIITSPGAGERTVQWLDRSLDIRRTSPIDLDEDRRPWLLLYVPCMLVLLYAAGRLVGRQAPERPVEPATRVGAGLLMLLAALGRAHADHRPRHARSVSSRWTSPTGSCRSSPLPAWRCSSLRRCCGDRPRVPSPAVCRR